jgi:hypothetical protein
MLAVGSTTSSVGSSVSSGSSGSVGSSGSSVSSTVGSSVSGSGVASGAQAPSKKLAIIITVSNKNLFFIFSPLNLVLNFELLFVENQLIFNFQQHSTICFQYCW